MFRCYSLNSPSPTTMSKNAHEHLISNRGFILGNMPYDMGCKQCASYLSSNPFSLIAWFLTSYLIPLNLDFLLKRRMIVFAFQDDFESIWCNIQMCLVLCLEFIEKSDLLLCVNYGLLVLQHLEDMTEKNSAFRELDSSKGISTTNNSVHFRQ